MKLKSEHGSDEEAVWGLQELVLAIESRVAPFKIKAVQTPRPNYMKICSSMAEMAVDAREG